MTNKEGIEKLAKIKSSLYELHLGLERLEDACEIVGLTNLREEMHLITEAIYSIEGDLYDIIYEE